MVRWILKGDGTLLYILAHGCGPTSGRSVLAKKETIVPMRIPDPFAGVVKIVLGGTTLDPSGKKIISVEVHHEGGGVTVGEVPFYILR